MKNISHMYNYVNAVFLFSTKSVVKWVFEFEHWCLMSISWVPEAIQGTGEKVMDKTNKAPAPLELTL